jgi:hypothetical protein
MQSNGKIVQTLEAAPQVPEVTLQATAMTLPAPEVTSQAPEVTSQVPAQSRRLFAMYQTSAGMEQRLQSAQIVIERVLADETLQSALALYGYGQPRMLQGKVLLEKAQELTQRQRAEIDEQRSAAEAHRAICAEARAFYMRHHTVAKVVLEGQRGAVYALGLKKARKRELAGWLKQARQFYFSALHDPTILEKLAIYGLTRERLEQGQSYVEAVMTSMATQLLHKGSKHGATRARDAAFLALDRWMKGFNTIARIALSNQS